MKKENKNNTSESKDNSKADTIRVSHKIKELLKSEVSKLNKAKKGSKRINQSDILEIVVPLLSEAHKLQLLAGTVTSINRQEIAFSTYSKKHKNVTENDFLDMVQFGEININDYLPDEMKRQRNNRENTKLEAV